MSKENKTGRPESFSAEYFSHSVHESDVLKVMYRKYKYEGFVAYYRLKEQVTKSDFHRIELKNDTQKHIFQMNMDVRQEVIDFLIDLLLQMGEMDKEQWEINQTIYLNKFVRQFKYLWYKRYKSIPDENGNYTDRTKKKDTNRVSAVGKGNNKVKYSSNNKVKESIKNSLSFSEYKEMYPNKDVEWSLNKYIDWDKNPSDEGAKVWLNREKKHKPKEYRKSTDGRNIAYCTKCGKQEFPDEFQLKQGSSCCRIEYTNVRPSNQQSSSLSSKKNNLSNNV